MGWQFRHLLAAECGISPPIFCTKRETFSFFFWICVFRPRVLKSPPPHIKIICFVYITCPCFSGTWKSELSSLRHYTSVHWKSHFLQSTRMTQQYFKGQPVLPGEAEALRRCEAVDGHHLLNQLTNIYVTQLLIYRPKYNQTFKSFFLIVSLYCLYTISRIYILLLYYIFNFFIIRE